MLDYKVERVDEVVLEHEALPPRMPRPLVRGVMLVLALVLVVGAILLARGWRPTATTASGASAAASMPTSAAIEAKYGIRFTSVDVTAGGGMIQLQYQIIDSDKTLAIHDAASAPFVIDANGVKYADPGMVGHSHVGKTKVAGTSDYILLANAKGGVKSGSIVTIKVGDLALRDVRAL
jgi:hypothetical protein